MILKPSLAIARESAVGLGPTAKRCLHIHYHVLRKNYRNTAVRFVYHIFALTLSDHAQLLHTRAHVADDALRIQRSLQHGCLKREGDEEQWANSGCIRWQGAHQRHKSFFRILLIDSINAHR